MFKFFFLNANKKSFDFFSFYYQIKDNRYLLISHIKKILSEMRLIL